MRILGIDPGYGITGFGLIEAQRGQYQLLNCGAITTPPNTEFAWRLEVIYNDMTELLRVSPPAAVASAERFIGPNHGHQRGPEPGRDSAGGAAGRGACF